MGRYYFKFNGIDIWVDNYLRYQFDSCIYNLKYNKQGDWDIMIIITGDRQVRTGKSTFAQLIGAYFSFRLGVPYTLNDIFFDSDVMIAKAMKKGKYGINHYDEARRGLSTSKRFKKVQEDIIDYFNECGQLNQINIITLPDYFTLNEEIAVARSEILINVYRDSINKFKDIYGDGEKIPIVEWKRGFFSFFSREKKSKLYDEFIRTRKKNYFAVKSDFNGNFDDFGIVPHEEYSNYKFQELKKYQKKKALDKKQENWKNERDILMYRMNLAGLPLETIGEYISRDRSTVGYGILNAKKVLGLSDEGEGGNTYITT